MKSTYRTLLSMSLLAVPPVVSAQSRDTTVVIDPVIVSATRVPTPLSSATQSVTVLKGDDLRARGVTTVALALREVPGAAAVQSGSYGSVTSLFLRGGESRYTKVLIDGVPINTVGGAFSFANLSTDNVDRIEVVRGPVSGLYGADAVSGVVQIFTRRGVPGKKNFFGSVRTGTYGHWEGDASVNGGNTFSTYSLGGGLHRTEGIHSFNNNFYRGTLTGAFTLSPDAVTTIAVTSQYTKAQYHFPTDWTGAVNDSNSYTDQHRFVTGVNAARVITPWLTLRVIGANNDVRDASEGVSSFGSAHTRTRVPAYGYRRQGEVQATFFSGVFGTWTFGSQYMKEYQHSLTRATSWTGSDIAGATTTETPRQNSRITRGYYAAVQGTPVSFLTYDASVRHDDHQDFKNATTYHTGARVSLFKGLSVRASYGTAFNAPSFDATQGSAYNAASPSLSPEVTHTVDGALEQSLWDGRVRASVGAFDQHFSQMLQYVVGSPSMYQNLTQARAKGYEGELHVLILDGLTADASYTQTIAKVYSVSPSYTGELAPGQELVRRPSHSGTANVTYRRLGLGSFGATTSYYGKRLDVDYASPAYPSPTVALPAYVRLDLSASVDVLRGSGPNLALTGRVENALDKKYEDVVHFQTPGRAVFIGIQVKAQR